MARLNVEGAVSTQHWLVPIEGIVVEQKNNNRFGTYTKDDFEDLLEDISSCKGIESPVICRLLPDGRPLLVEGYRRYASVKYWNQNNPPSKLVKLPVILRTMNDEEALESNIAENVKRRNLTPMDAAIGIRNLTNAGKTDEQIARLYDKSPAWVSQNRKLLTLDRKTQAMVHLGSDKGRRGGMPAAAAIELADMRGEERNIVIVTIENDFNGKFSVSNVRKVAREIGAIGDGVTPVTVKPAADTDPDDLLNSAHTKGHTPKRKQRSICELNDYWDKWEGADTITKAGHEWVKKQQGLISGRVTDHDMDRMMIEVFGAGRQRSATEPRA